MKIAIPAFNTKVSPRFDTAQELVLLEIDAGHVTHRERRPLQSSNVSDRIRALTTQGVKILICGGIDQLSRQQLSFNQIEVYSWVTGEVDDAVSCFLRNGLNSRTILGRNGKKEGRWRFRQRSFLRNVLQKSAHREIEIQAPGFRDGQGPGHHGNRCTGRGRGKGQERAETAEGRRRKGNPEGPGRSGWNKNHEPEQKYS